MAHRHSQIATAPRTALLSTLTPSFTDDLAAANAAFETREFITIDFMRAFIPMVAAAKELEALDAGTLYPPEIELLDSEDVESRLRALTYRGFLRMSAHRDETGAFVEYRWTRA